MNQELARRDGADPLYAALAAPMPTLHDTRGGASFDYVTGESCISRLNEVLGVHAWDFVIREHGIHQEADEAWVLGQLRATFGAATVVHEQFGSQKLKRSRTSGAPLDIGFDLKGAATDALKKCATQIGVGLWLSEKDGQQQPEQQQPHPKSGGAGGATQRAAGRPASNGAAGGSQAPGGSDPGPVACEDCGNVLTETRFKDGTVWSPAQLAGFGRRKHGHVLCMEHYRQQNESRAAAVMAAPRRPGVPVHEDQDVADQAAAYDRLVAANYPDEAGPSAPTPPRASAPQQPHAEIAPATTAAPATPTRRLPKREVLWDRYVRLLAQLPDEQAEGWGLTAEMTDEEIADKGLKLKALLAQVAAPS